MISFGLAFVVAPMLAVSPPAPPIMLVAEAPRPRADEPQVRRRDSDELRSEELRKHDKRHRLPLLIAAEAGQPGTVKLLLRQGADVNMTTPDGVSALHLAAKGGHILVVDLLIEMGARVDAADGLGATPLHYAAQGGDERVVKHLLEQRVRVNTADQLGNTPLSLAQRGRHPRIERLLIEYGAAD